MPSRLLFISPCFPAPEGNGPARRAHAVITALSRRHEVSLLVITRPYDDHRAPPAPPAGCATCVHIASDAGDPREHLRRRRLARWFPRVSARWLGRPSDWLDHTRSRLRLAAAGHPDTCFEVIHAFRLSMAPYALALHRAQGGRPALHLDIDDLESLAHARLSALHEINGDHRAARREHLDSAAYARQERALCKRFRRLYVCSHTDARRLRGAHPDIRVLSNTVAIPPSPPPPPPDDNGFNFLFIGSLGYHPNQDALRWFCDRVLPGLRASCRCELIVAGHPGPPALEDFLRRQPGVRFIGRVESAASAYASAHAVIAPLRAGAGTRLKILEAFALGRPVVCTPIGVEGIDIEPGTHCLAAETPAEFAEACRLLVMDFQRRNKLAADARAFVAARHSPAVLAAALD